MTRRGGCRDEEREHQHALLDEAIRLRLEVPARSAAHTSEIVAARHEMRITERTLAEPLRRRGVTRGELLRDGRTFGRYEADAPNERWIGDVLVGPFVPHPRAPGSVRAENERLREVGPALDPALAGGAQPRADHRSEDGSPACSRPSSGQ